MKSSDVPEGWKRLSVQDVAEILDSKRIPLNSDERFLMKGSIPYFGANGVVDYINDYLFDEELILIAEDGGNFDDYQKRAIAYRISGKSWVNNHAHVLRVKSDYAFDYIFYLLEHKNIIPIIKGGTRSKLNQAELRHIPIVAPESLDEQRKIASVILVIDKAIEKTKALMEKNKKIKQGLIKDLVCDCREKEEIRIEKVVSFLSRGKSPEYVDRSDFFIVNQACIQWDEFKTSNLKCVAASYWQTIPWKYKTRIGDIFINSTGTGTIGRIQYCALKLEYTWDSHVTVIRTNERVWAKYLYYIFQTPQFQKDLETYCITGSTNQIELSVDKLNKLLINIHPSIEEQKQIASVLTCLDNKLNSYNTYLEKLIRIKAGLMQDLLTGRLRIKAAA